LKRSGYDTEGIKAQAGRFLLIVFERPAFVWAFSYVSIYSMSEWWKFLVCICIAFWGE